MLNSKTSWSYEGIMKRIRYEIQIQGIQGFKKKQLATAIHFSVYFAMKAVMEDGCTMKNTFSKY